MHKQARKKQGHEKKSHLSKNKRTPYNAMPVLSVSAFTTHMHQTLYELILKLKKPFFRDKCLKRMKEMLTIDHTHNDVI